MIFFPPSDGQLLPACVDGEARFELGREIGSGAQGVVFEGRDLQTGRKVAIKVYKPLPLAEQDKTEAYHVHLAELARRMALLAEACPGLVPEPIAFVEGVVIRRPDVASDAPDSLPFFVMELIEGEPLRDVLRGLDRSRRKRLGMALATALYAIARQLHGCGWVHGDLDTRNVMISPGEARPRLVVLDLDAAHLDSDPDGSAVGLLTHNSAAWLHPEQQRFLADRTVEATLTDRQGWEIAQLAAVVRRSLQWTDLHRTALRRGRGSDPGLQEALGYPGTGVDVVPDDLLGLLDELQLSGPHTAAEACELVAEAWARSASPWAEDLGELVGALRASGLVAYQTLVPGGPVAPPVPDFETAVPAVPFVPAIVAQVEEYETGGGPSGGEPRDHVPRRKRLGLMRFAVVAGGAYALFVAWLVGVWLITTSDARARVDTTARDVLAYCAGDNPVGRTCRDLGVADLALDAEDPAQVANAERFDLLLAEAREPGWLPGLPLQDAASGVLAKQACTLRGEQCSEAAASLLGGLEVSDPGWRRMVARSGAYLYESRAFLDRIEELDDDDFEANWQVFLSAWDAQGDDLDAAWALRARARKSVWEGDPRDAERWLRASTTRALSVTTLTDEEGRRIRRRNAETLAAMNCAQSKFLPEDLPTTTRRAWTVLGAQALGDEELARRYRRITRLTVDDHDPAWLCAISSFEETR